MIVFKNNAGFTLIETLLAVAVVAMMLVPLYMLQANVMRNAARYSQHVERIMQAKLFLIDSAIANLKETQPVTLEKKIKDPVTDAKFTMKKIAENSSLNKFKNMYTQQVSITWQENRKRRTDSLVTFIFKPEQPPKEQKK